MQQSLFLFYVLHCKERRISTRADENANVFSDEIVCAVANCHSCLFLFLSHIPNRLRRGRRALNSLLSSERGISNANMLSWETISIFPLSRFPLLKSVNYVTIRGGGSLC